MQKNVSELTVEEIDSLLESLPDEQVARDLAKSYEDVSAGVRMLGRELRTGNRRTVYPYTNLQQHQFQLIAEIQRYIQLHSDAFGVVASELGTIQDELMKAYVAHLAEVRIIMSKLDALETGTAELSDLLENKASRATFRKALEAVSTRNSKIKHDIEDELHQLSKTFSKEMGGVLALAARRLKDELS